MCGSVEVLSRYLFAFGRLGDWPCLLPDSVSCSSHETILEVPTRPFHVTRCTVQQNLFDGFFGCLPTVVAIRPHHRPQCAWLLVVFFFVGPVHVVKTGEHVRTMQPISASEGWHRDNFLECEAGDALWLVLWTTNGVGACREAARGVRLPAGAFLVQIRQVERLGGPDVSPTHRASGRRVGASGPVFVQTCRSQPHARFWLRGPEPQ